MVVSHTHDLKVTKEALHGMCKLLQEALWSTTSTKELGKDQVDTIIDHFTALFAKVGLELPPFPNDPTRYKKPDYPEFNGPPTV